MGKSLGSCFFETQCINAFIARLDKIWLHKAVNDLRPIWQVGPPETDQKE